MCEVERHLAEKSGDDVSILGSAVAHIIKWKMLTHPCLENDEEDDAG